MVAENKENPGEYICERRGCDQSFTDLKNATIHEDRDSQHLSTVSLNNMREAVGLAPLPQKGDLYINILRTTTGLDVYSSKTLSNEGALLEAYALRQTLRVIEWEREA